MGSRLLRTLASALLLIVGALALAGAIAAHWLDNVLLDTDTFIEASEPLLTDPIALERTSDRISAAIVGELDIAAIVAQEVPAEMQPMAQDFVDDFEEFVDEQVSNAVSSPAFASLTRTNLRRWHMSFEAEITGRDTDDGLEGTVIRVVLGPYINLLAEQTDTELLRAALEFVPEDVRQARVALFNVQPFVDRLSLLRTLRAARPFLPWIALAALVGGVLVAPRRDYGVIGAGLIMAVTGGLLGSIISAEVERVVELLGGSLGASESAARQAVNSLAGPMYDSAVWMTLSGVGLVLIGIGLALWRIWRVTHPRRPQATP